MTSSGPQNSTSWSPTMLPPRTALMADLLGVALLADGGAVIDVMVCAVVLFVDGVSSIRAVPLGASSLL